MVLVVPEYQGRLAQRCPITIVVIQFELEGGSRFEFEPQTSMTLNPWNMVDPPLSGAAKRAPPSGLH